MNYLEKEWLIKRLDEHIRKIVREEISCISNVIREVVKETPSVITIQKSYLVDVPSSEK